DWSPDGTRIVFVHRNAQTGTQSLAVIHTDGSELTLLKGNDASGQCSTTDAYLPTWSPNGQRIAFGTRMSGQAEYVSVCTMNTDGSNIRPLVADPSVLVFGRAAWSPDGSRIAVSALENREGGQNELLVSYSADSPGERQVHFRAPANWGGSGTQWTSDGKE